ncbi:MAG: hypothetical protein LBB88_07135 [Planctomycetaceae bacterium]|jgi:hypothetical protein|nr:hypothetical protein [Planctomycetaceae bacterium]
MTQLFVTDNIRKYSFDFLQSSPVTDITTYQENDNIDYTKAYSSMTGKNIERNFEPYICLFERHWNTYLERETKLFAEVYSKTVNGMIGVAFYVVNRLEFPDKMQIINDSFEKLKIDFPDVSWSQITVGFQFIDITDKIIIVIKPDSHHCWGKEQSTIDADETIGRHFVDTMPEEWKYKK